MCDRGQVTSILTGFLICKPSFTGPQSPKRVGVRRAGVAYGGEGLSPAPPLHTTRRCYRRKEKLRDRGTSPGSHETTVTKPTRGPCGLRNLAQSENKREACIGAAARTGGSATQLPLRRRGLPPSGHFWPREDSVVKPIRSCGVWKPILSQFALQTSSCYWPSLTVGPSLASFLLA